MELEIADLARSPWTRPGIAVPIIATVITLGISQYLGVFDVARQRMEIANEKALIAKQQIAADIAQLAQDKNALAEEKVQLDGEVARMKTEAAAEGNVYRDKAEKFFPAILEALEQQLNTCTSSKTYDISPQQMAAVASRDLLSCFDREFNDFPFTKFLDPQSQNEVRKIYRSVARDASKMHADWIRRLRKQIEATTPAQLQDRFSEATGKLHGIYSEYPDLVSDGLAQIRSIKL